MTILLDMTDPNSWARQYNYDIVLAAFDSCLTRAAAVGAFLVPLQMEVAQFRADGTVGPYMAILTSRGGEPEQLASRIDQMAADHPQFIAGALEMAMQIHDIREWEPNGELWEKGGNLQSALANYALSYKPLILGVVDGRPAVDEPETTAP